MKTTIGVLLVTIALWGCNNQQEKERIQRMQTMRVQDSVMRLEAAKKDSTITEYVKTMNDIQDNLDKIKTAEKILTVNAQKAESRRNPVQDIRNINDLLLKYHKQIYALENKLRGMESKNKEVERMQAHLEQELAEKDSGIAVMQKRIAGMSDSMRFVMKQFNDSLVVINNQKMQISGMTTEMHTVYYAVGTMKDFKKEGVISKQGGFAGIGKTATLKTDFNASKFTKGDMTKITVIPLNKRFDKMVTPHPANSYTIVNNSKRDSLIIKDPVAFWSESKFLVVAVK